MPHPDPLGVLVVEADPGAASMVSTELVDAGHRVVRCHEPGADAFPCVGLAEGGACPLDGGEVDVVLDVRGLPRSKPAVTETGVTCSLRDRLPLVVAGTPALNPFAPHATTTMQSTDPSEIVDALEQAARAPMEAHGAAGTDAVRSAISALGVDPGESRVEVQRRHGVLLMTAFVPGAVPEKEIAALASHVVQAVRELDSRAAGADVTVERLD